MKRNVFMPPAICNGCGNESPAWDQLCEGCSQHVTCQNCNGKYKRGQGLQEVSICAACLQEVLTNQDEEEEEVFRPKKSAQFTDVEQNDPYAEYGFDHQWELYDR